MLRRLNDGPDNSCEDDTEYEESPPYTLVVHGLSQDWMEKVGK